MCECDGSRQPAASATSRRAVLAGAAALAGVAALGGRRARAAAPVEVRPGLSILPRDAWGADLTPKGPIAVETPRFLLVHHTASTNAYASAREVIRSTYAFQTGPAKGWNDVCYEFFIGRDGDVWEGRAGALSGPVVADATGGSQGFAQLICLLGDFTVQPPTIAAQAALAQVLGWLADRDGIDIDAGATASFVSRGSQRWPASVAVTTPTIAGHRDMSYTQCPGDFLYELLPALRESARGQRDIWRSGMRPARRLGPIAP